MRRPTVLLALLLTTAALTAQSNSATAGAVFTASPGSEACPISLFAERRSNPTLAQAGTSSGQNPGQSLHLTFNHLDSPPIVGADIAVHASSATSRILPAATSANGNLVKTFHPALTAAEANLSIHDVSAIHWIELTSIQYADGTSWKTSSTSRCRATPNPVILIGSLR